MQLVHLAAAVLNQTALDWPGNERNIRAAIAQARAAGASVLCLPEMCIPGYGCEDAFLSRDVQEQSLAVLRELLPATAGLIVSFGLPLAYRNGLFNVVALAVDGRLAGFVAKRYLAGDGLHYEPRWFKPWPVSVRSDIEIGGESFPIGDVSFACGGAAGIHLGFEICEDAWVSNRPGIRLAERAVDVILNPSGSHFAFGKLDVRERFVVEGSRAFGATYVYANLVGNAAGRAIYDGGALIASGGELCAAGSRFSFADVEVTDAVVDVSLTRMKQTRIAGFTPSFARGDDCVQVPFTFPTLRPQRKAITRAGWEASGALKEEEFTRAVTLALFDYMRKSRARGFVVSISGGADSAAVTILCALALRRALAELGPEGLAEKLGYLGTLPREPAALVRRLVTCVYQATRNSGSVTFEAAAGVARAMDATFLRFDVDALVQGYVGMVSGALGRELTWERDDVTLQNIQARARAPGIWMVANMNGALLLSTSNRSEAAVGYATMDGDTAGGLSPIAGIDKAFLRRWLTWMEQQGPAGMERVPALAAVNAQAPTAELRPPSAGQTDEDDLMPYPVLDAIERLAIRDKQSPAEIYTRMRAEVPGYGAAQMAAWVERFFTLWCRNQWKRERYAPSFHLDDENLDPKTWCRFPILSGGYARELQELRRLVAADTR